MDVAVNKRNRIIKLLCLLSAFATVLIYIGFPIFPQADNLELDFSDVPALLAGALVSPAAGVFIIFIKNIFNVIMGGGAHMLLGAFQNFICGVALMLPCCLMIRKARDEGADILCRLPVYMVYSSFIQMAVAMLSNLLIMVSLHPSFFEQLSVGEYMFMVVVFNVIKNVTVCILFYLAYKYIYPKLKIYIGE